MNATVITATIETFALGNGLHVDEKTRLRLLAIVGDVKAAPFATLDAAEQFLRVEFPNWFVHRGGHHVSLHRQSGGVRVLLVAERDVETVATPTFATIKAAVTCARDEARSEARQTMRAINNLPRKFGQRVVKVSFIRSRGQHFLSLNDKTGRAGAFEEQAAWDGTKRDLMNAIAQCEADLRCDELVLSGGFDVSESFDFDDYEPEVSSWSVTVWTRAQGLVCLRGDRD